MKTPSRHSFAKAQGSGEVRVGKVSLRAMSTQLAWEAMGLDETTKQTGWMEKRRGLRAEAWACQHLEARLGGRVSQGTRSER